MDDATTAKHPDLVILNQRSTLGPLHKWPDLSIAQIADGEIAGECLGESR